MRVSKLLNFLYKKKKKEKTLQGAKMYRQFCYFFFPKEKRTFRENSPSHQTDAPSGMRIHPIVPSLSLWDKLALPAVYQQWKEIPRLMDGKSDRQPRHL